MKNKRKRQKIFVLILLSLVLVMGGFQVYDYIKNIEKAEDVKYTAVIFNAPMQQSTEVLMISANEEKDSVIDNESNVIQYSDLKNYKEENLERYKAYHKKNPDLLDAEVIWRTNAKLDYDFYTNVEEVKDLDSITIVVNKYYKLPDNYEPEDLEIVEEEYYLRKEAKDAYLNLKEAIKEQDLGIQISSAYRSYASQEKLYNKTLNEQGKEAADKLGARAGHSEHQTGLAVDVADDKAGFTPFGETEEYAWIKENAHRFGFIIRYREDPALLGYENEPWHLRYVGEEVAIDMYESNIHILEEYLDKKIIKDNEEANED